MKVYQINFSPTGGTKKAADILTGALNGETEVIDLTNAHGDFGSVALTKEDIAVIAVPSYGGRVPGLQLSALQKYMAMVRVQCWSACTATVPMRTRWWKCWTPPDRQVLT